MRLCLVAQEYPPETAHGGIATQTHAKAHGLSALGHEVVVLSHSLDANRHEAWDGAVRVVRLPGHDEDFSPQTEAARWVTWSARVAAGLSRLGREAPFDLVDFPEWGAEGFVWLLDRPEWDRTPATVHLQGPLVMLAESIGWPETDSELYRTGRTMEAACLRLADAVYSSSACSATACERHHGLHAADIPILHTGVDTERFRPAAASPEGAPSILFVGRIARSKGVDALVDAAVRLAPAHPGLTLRLVGRGEENLIADLRRRAAGCPGLLDLVGFLPHEELPAEMARADLFAAPSRYEGGPGFVYLEAMACGLPAIACAGSGATEVIEDGENGLLVPPDDPEALAAALARLLGNREERRAMGARARERVVREADRRHCLRLLESFYQSVVDRGRR